jgi:hypothetical protein
MDEIPHTQEAMYGDSIWRVTTTGDEKAVREAVCCTLAGAYSGLWFMYLWLDRAPKGCDETGVWRRRHVYDIVGPLKSSCGHFFKMTNSVGGAFLSVW